MLGENIYKLRTANNLTQKELAESVGVSQMAISAFERGVKIPSIAILTRLADVFNCTADMLIGRDKGGAFYERRETDRKENRGCQ